LFCKHNVCKLKVNGGGSERLLYTRTHEIDTPLKRPHYELHLPRALVRVLTTGYHIKGRSSMGIKAKENFFSCHGLQYILFGYKTKKKEQALTHFSLDVIGGDEVVDTKLSSPFQRLFQSLDGFLACPFGSAQVPGSK
jgi:hypothetical protein